MSETLVTKIVSIVLPPKMDIKEHIKEKADDLFRKYGIKSVTMDDIAAHAGMSKKTIYHSFSDKKELVDEVVEDILITNKICCAESQENATNAIEELFLAMENLHKFLGNINPSILFDIQRGYPVTYNRFLKYKQDFLFTLFKKNLIRGINEELYRPELNVEIISRMRLEMVMLPFKEDIFPTNKKPLFEVQEELTEYFLFGVASPKGYKLIMKYIQERTEKKNTKKES
ncbi:MAG: TetR/AcrR family transcriptional regulator [Ginsengibacter sp.]